MPHISCHRITHLANTTLIDRRVTPCIVPAVLGNGEIVDSFSFSAATQGKYAVVVFYPLDFTFEK
jgi:peroxiredoxin (alkyl hydroperoxide reductase subunit C)